MAIYKLKSGERLVMTVTKVVLDVPATNPRYGPSTKFVGRTETDPDACVFLTPATADRQLERLKLTVDSVIGQTLEFAKPGEYIDINRPNGNGAAQGSLPIPSPAAAAPAAKVPAPSTAKQGFSAGPHVAGLDPEPAAATRLTDAQKDAAWKRLTSLHRGCLQYVLTRETPILDGPQVGMSPEAASALAGQLFNAALQLGLHQ